MKPVPLAAAAALTAYGVIRRRKLGRLELGGGALVVAACLLVGLGIVEVPNVVGIIEDVGRTLGPYTYLAVGVLAFLETGAFVGLVAPGETAVLVGGVVAGQGEISPVILIAIVWSCAVAGDLTSYTLGRRLGRGFLLEHGGRLKITEARLSQVEGFFERRGGVTILVGRFIGLVRALAPFIAGASRMPLGKFIPYDVLGAGLWASLFVMLGYVFWRSIDTVTEYVGRGLLVFGAVVGLVIALVYTRRLIIDEAARAKARAWIEARPALRPLVPVGRRLLGPARFVYGRLTPGDLGLELTTLLSFAAVGSFGFLAMGEALDDGAVYLFGDRAAADLARALYSEPVERVVRVATDIGSLPAAGALTLLTAGWAIARRRPIDGIALVVALAATWIAVDLAKEAVARPRPAEPLVATMGLSYPSGHAAYSIALIACAVALVRGGQGIALRFAAVTVAVVLAVLVAASRVYLRAHYLSDVLGGLGVGALIYSVVGIVALAVAFVRHNPRS